MNAKLEQLARDINDTVVVHDFPLPFIAHKLKSLEPDLAIAQAAREWLKWHNNADECNKAEHKLRAAIERAK